MIDNSSKWSMEFTNDEIKRYLADKTKEWAEVCYLVDDIYVEQDSKDNFDYITFDGTKQNFYISFYGTQTAILMMMKKNIIHQVMFLIMWFMREG